MKKKKNRKLLMQVLFITFPILMLMLIVMVWAVYESSVDGFLEAKNDHMEYIIDLFCQEYCFYDDDVAEWYFDAWESDPEHMREKYTPEEEQSFMDAFNAWSDDTTQIEWMKSLPPMAQNYYAKGYYEVFIDETQRYGTESGYEELFILDMTDDYTGMIIVDYRRSSSALLMGDYISSDFGDHSVVKEMKKSGSGKMFFEKATDFPEEGNYYIAYKPLYFNNKLRQVVGVVYKWDDFRETMGTTLNKALFIGIGGMLLALVILLVMLYRRAIAPVSKLQKIVLKYREDKDSDAVVMSTAEIKERNEIGSLSDDIAELAKEIDQYTEDNIRLVSEKERVSAELDMARKIQAEQLPNVFPAFPDRDEFDIYASMTPAKEVGGDFYDFFFIDKDHLALVMADVSGKGVPAALFMMMSKILINNYATMGLPPHEILERTNQTICKNNKQKMFVTVWLGIYEISTGKVVASNAGHENPVICRPDGTFSVFDDGEHGFVIGGLKKVKYTEYEFTLEKGGALFVYTDGLPEATDSGDKMFGMERLLSALNSDPDASPEQLNKNVNKAVHNHVKKAPQFDDITMLAIRRRK
ncbi:MAG: serine/threonine-protein phosphatase [Eubacterium sp.]|nr:serine/threonine-protein phosphatase [Eubacterium sp.]